MPGGLDPLWEQRIEVMHAPDRGGLPRWLARFLRVCRHHDVVILRGTVSFRERYRDLVGAACLRVVRRPPPRIVVSDATLEPASRALGRKLRVLQPALPALSRTLVRGVDGEHVTWCVLSSGERETFHRTFGVPKDRICFTPFTHTLYNGIDLEQVADDGYIWSGGDSLRDYELLARASDGLGVPVRIASSWHPAESHGHVRSGRVPHEEFVRQMSRCTVVVVPLAESSRSTGQQTYLNAMALGKLVVVTDRLGVRDHVRHDVTGVVAPPTIDGLRAALIDVLDPARAEHYRAVAAAGRRSVLEHYTPDAYRRRLLRVAGVLDDPVTEGTPAR